LCFYILADEVLHEKFFPVVKEAMLTNLNKEDIEGLKFHYTHFYGSYDFVQDDYRNWYIKEVRIIKNRDNILSWGDAMDFRHPDGSKLKSKDIDAEIYHYGWVRPPEKLLNKRIDFEKLYNDAETAAKKISAIQHYNHLGNLKEYKDTHPEVMVKRISESKWGFDAKLSEQNPDWIRKILIFLNPLLKRINKSE